MFSDLHKLKYLSYIYHNYKLYQYFSFILIYGNGNPKKQHGY